MSFRQLDLFNQPLDLGKNDNVLLGKAREPIVTKYKHGVEEVYKHAQQSTANIKALIPHITHELVTDLSRLEEYLANILKVGAVAIDTETSGLDPRRERLGGISMYTEGESAIYIPIGHHFYKNNVDARDFITRLTQYTYQGKIKVFMHNGRYDNQVFRRYTGLPMYIYFDTLIASSVLDENEYDISPTGEYVEVPKGAHGLKRLWNKYCVANKYKSMSYSDLFENRDYTTFDPEQVYVYATLDSVMTWQLGMYQLPYLTQGSQLNLKYGLQQVANVFWHIEMPVSAIAEKMEWRGVRYSREKNLELQKTMEKDIRVATKKFVSRLDKIVEENKHNASLLSLDKLTDPINPMSSTQMNIILFEIMGLKLSDQAKRQIRRQKSKSGKHKSLEDIPWESSGKVAQQDINTNYPEHVELIQEFRDLKGLQKLYTSFVIGLRKLYNEETDSIHGGWNTVGTLTGRLSSSNPNL